MGFGDSLLLVSPIHTFFPLLLPRRAVVHVTIVRLAGVVPQGWRGEEWVYLLPLMHHSYYREARQTWGSLGVYQ
ncbi:hypothetical protein CRG98_050136 [Punica granatum]|uniref:Uncharacterized protein n=1 Tax=Punica granatum TaxID=22663 RepID=A0A2I0GTU1_PUNGR|nr:hypothetical protein CRG98_050136 [Punica granatum]